ncbi:MAG TPA: TPM domain-containing protein [Lacunisphaera sp.]
MKKSTFTKQLDHPAVEAAIARAETATSGEIRVVVFHQPAPEPVATARAAFTRLKMEQTRERNGVLIFIAPMSQTFAVIGDEGVHLKCGQTFWDELAAVMAGAFQRGEFTAGLIAGIERAGALLAAHFPRRSDDINELPDGVVEQ